MDYTVGSLADLISGNNTPNKIKVKKILVKQRKKENKHLYNLSLDQECIVDANVKKEKKKKRESLPENGQDNLELPSKKKKIRKLSSNVKDLSEETTQENAKGNSEIISKKKEKRKLKSNENDLPMEENNDFVYENVKGNPDIILKKKKKYQSNKSDLGEEKEQNKTLHENGEISLEPAFKKKKFSDLADSDQEQESEEQNVNTINQIKKKVKKDPDPEEQARTIFVGNIPITSKKKQVKNFFKKYGPIESIRFRGIPVADPKIPKKVAAIKKEFHPDRSSILCYIRFVNKEDAQQAAAENGNIFKEHHLRVHLCGSTEKNDECKAIFIGNLNFRAEEEQLWKLFESCGQIESVRIVRDSHTGMGKGFGYVNFKDEDAVQLALEMENVKLGDRELRIKLSSASNAKKNKKKDNKINATRRMNLHQKKNGFGENDGNNAKKNNKSFESNNKSFRGATYNNKKRKFKINKGALEKKRNIKNVAPISK